MLSAKSTSAPAASSTLKKMMTVNCEYLYNLNTILNTNANIMKYKLDLGSVSKHSGKEERSPTILQTTGIYLNPSSGR